MPMSKSGKDLSEEQRAVVEAPDVPLITVRALAGTGKTTTIIERIAELVGKEVRQEEIQIICFSRDAVNQLKAQLTAKRLDGVNVRTLHEVCINLLNKKLVAREKSIVYQRAVNSVHSHVKWITSESRPNETLEKHIDYLLHHILPSGIQSTEELTVIDRHLVYSVMEQLNKAKETTHTASLWQALQLLQAQPEKVERVLAGCHYLISDEYQDVSPLQHALFLELARGRSFMVVGDPFQSIYSFQGAKPQLLRQMEREGMAFSLSRNFRSPAHHLFLANLVLKIHQAQNGNRVEEDNLFAEQLVPTLPPVGKLSVHTFDDEQNCEGIFVKAVRQALNNAQQNEVVVIARYNSILNKLAGVLLNVGIPVRIADAKPAIQPSVVRFGLMPLARCLQGCLPERERKPGPHPLSWMLVKGGNEQLNLTPELRKLLNLAWSLGRRSSDLLNLVLDDESSKQIEQVLGIWQRVERLAGAGLTGKQLLQRVQSLALMLWPEQKQTILTVRTWQELVKGELIEGSNIAVELRTIHKAKGQQWPYVFLWEEKELYFSEEKDWWDESGEQPIRYLASTPPLDLAEEIRMRYVALTRSERDLTVFIHENCLPAYQEAFCPEHLESARQIQRLFSGEQAWEVDDERALLSIMTLESPESPLRKFAEESWPKYAHPEILLRAIRLLQGAGQELPDEWKSRLSTRGQSVLQIPQAMTRLPLIRAQDKF